ncbi:MAG: formate dehydrogenase accessory sulfurtransferase FdhD [Gammaproteobacteria bacterium]|nr:formate dehydrogenase accessory sulfurtransferase FdhD [Gammaproteobacteria bacterium]MDE0252485.1 formate dehydrogenase accessory sulfurtransferase FdhD [Gammaproteobacteria bacterium]MDE0403516.1 formate dehydrogenase accessory sulfurtransferase FdhD [Gammaproteobacteria bacterium]
MEDLRSLPYPIRRFNGQSSKRLDYVTREEPLELKLEYFSKASKHQTSIAVTMRTPGDDIDLAHGFLLSEGVINSFDQVEDTYFDSPNENSNTLVVCLKQGVEFDAELLLRHFYTSSSCGVCGKVSLAAVAVHVPKFETSSFQIPRSTLHQLPTNLRQLQSEFRKTGGLHASALFDTEGTIYRVREDIGRHNALDKLIGSFRSDNLSNIRQFGLLLSGRASFELLQKAAIVGIPFVAAIGSPSSLAIDLAQEQRITLVGFLSRSNLNIYCGERVCEH